MKTDTKKIVAKKDGIIILECSLFVNLSQNIPMWGIKMEGDGIDFGRMKKPIDRFKFEGGKVHTEKYEIASQCFNSISWFARVIFEIMLGLKQCQYCMVWSDEVKQKKILTVTGSGNTLPSSSGQGYIMVCPECIPLAKERKMKDNRHIAYDVELRNLEEKK